ncbi:DUF349 domain-containing protein [Aliamphritea hakodatensis]|uniref:DUF349 domain-containing protein n=1 Tax=Aliamphritea hakodatensis TaxID=2895352 RepID=UPI0022FD4E71|nr:DUF349 domain-containing protein [Aliamphritea hakodatensis]
MFAKFFKPKWQHSKADVRIRAITKLKASNSEQHQILSQLALQDQNPAVRSAAVIKLEEPELLCRISNIDTDHQVRHLAADRACRVIIKTDNCDQQQSINSIRQLQDDDILTHIALHIDDSTVQQVAIEKISDQTCLGTITLQAGHSQTRQAAAEKLHEAEIIEQLSKEIRSKDKTVHRIIRNKLRDIREQQKAREQLLQQQTELTSALQQLLNTGMYPQFEARLNAYQQNAEKLLQNNHSDDTARTLLTEALNACQQLLQQEQQKQAEQQQREAEALQRQQQRDTLLAAFNELLKQIRATLEETLPDPAEFTAKLNDLQASQQTQSSGDPEFAQITGQLSSKSTQIQSLLDAVNRAQQNNAQLTELLQNETADSAALKHAIQLINWPENEPQPEGLRTLQKRLDQQNQVRQQHKAERQQVQQQDQQQIDSCLDQLEQALSEGNTKNAYRLDKRVTELLGQQAKNSVKSCRNRHAGLQKQLQQLKDWQGFAVTPKKESLCEKMEALIGNPAEAAVLADHIRALQQEWKDLDATDPYHSHDLWKRFKQASDQAYEPCSQHYAELKQQRVNNLQQRLLLCEQLETLMANTDWEQPDWQEVEQISRTAKQEWRQYTPVDRTPGREAQSRFNSTLKQLDGKIKAYREANAEVKQTLADQATALCAAAEQAVAEGQPELLNALLRQVKQLQQQWRQTGNSFHSVERKLWPAFRLTCNKVYELEKSNRKAVQSQQTEQEKAGQLCEQLEALQTTPASPSQISNLLEQADILCQKNDTPEPLQQRLHAAKSNLQRQQADLDRLLESETYQAWQRKINLCEQLEEKLLAEELDDNTLEQLNQAWEQGLSPDAPFAELLHNRFITGCNIHQGSQEFDPVIYASDTALRQLCIQLEIAFNLSSPEEDQALRLEYQMQRLQQALEEKHSSTSLKDLKHLEMEWLCQPFARHQEALYQRFYGLLQQVL